MSCYLPRIALQPEIHRTWTCYLKRALFFVLTSIATACVPSNAERNKFLASAYQDSLAEVQLCKLALDQSSDGEVKTLARRMLDDHTAAAQELETLAGKLSIPLPRDISDKQKSVLAAIKRLSGPEFNTRFVDYNIDEHEVDVKDFNKQLAAASDADVKAFISRMLPMLNAHLDLARAVQQKSKTQ
jgi:putative membrane protein